MTVNELHDALTELIKADKGDLEVHVHAMTGRLSGRSTVPVKSVSSGFDWDYGKLLIHPEETLFGEALARKRRNN